jgi:hypothetical protein
MLTRCALRMQGTHRRLAKKRVQCLNEALFFISISVLRDSLVFRNPLLRQAPKRWEKSPFGTLFPIGSRYAVAVKTSLPSHDVLPSNALTDFLREQALSKTSTKREPLAETLKKNERKY